MKNNWRKPALRKALPALRATSERKIVEPLQQKKICSWNRTKRAREWVFSASSPAGRGAMPVRAKQPTAIVELSPIRLRALRDFSPLATPNNRRQPAL